MIIILAQYTQYSTVQYDTHTYNTYKLIKISLLLPQVQIFAHLSSIPFSALCKPLSLLHLITLYLNTALMHYILHPYRSAQNQAQHRICCCTVWINKCEANVLCVNRIVLLCILCIIIWCIHTAVSVVDSVYTSIEKDM
jgi:hypothetical protein